MHSTEDEIFMVVSNDEGQYALWPSVLELPAGWTAAGFQGDKADCSAYVREVWTDMRPRSIREP